MFNIQPNYFHHLAFLPVPYSRTARLTLIGLTLGVQKRLAGYSSQCRLVAALPDLHQRELRPHRSWNWRTHSSVSFWNKTVSPFSPSNLLIIKFNYLIFLSFFPPQCLRTCCTCSRNRLPLRPPLGILHHLGDGAAKAGTCHRHLRSHLGHPDSAVFPALSEVRPEWRKMWLSYLIFFFFCPWIFTKAELLFLLCRFKEHVQGNHPKHFLSEEEFVQLRQELSKASLTQMGGEQDETPAVQEELPPGTEDLADPAKVGV